MIDYRTPVPEILFTMNHAAQAAGLKDWDADFMAELMNHAARFIDEVVAPLDPIADSEGARLVDGRVRMPKAMKDAYAVYRDGGWCALVADPQYGGQGISGLFSGAFAEMLSGACISFHMSVSLAQSAVRTLAANATDETKALWIPRLASGDWMATMCLSEPQAGSDLALIRTTASPRDGAWAIDGGKIFISGGDQDLNGRALHLVLARTPDAPPGLQGLSLFLAPSELEDGQRNRISIVRIEEKMGLHSSPTCQVAFDGARAEMIGAPGEGLKRMFTLMNLQRLDVSLQGIGLADCASQRTRAYAETRRQGKQPGVSGPAPINAHEDVRRMLMTQMALAMGGRAMCYRVLADIEASRGGLLVDMMTSVCKYFCTEAAFTSAQMGIQAHGGYGFLHEYRLEQILRDSVVTRIYEGTNGIHAATLANRLIRNEGMVAEFRGAVEKAIADIRAAQGEAFAKALAGVLDHWLRATEAVAKSANSGAIADAYMKLTGLTAFGMAWAQLEAAADDAPNPAKIHALAAFVRDFMLPETASHFNLCVSGVKLSEVPASVFEA